jgi:hypothetical protein
VRAQVDSGLTTVSYFDQLLGLIKNLGRHRRELRSRAPPVPTAAASERISAGSRGHGNGAMPASMVADRQPGAPSPRRFASIGGRRRTHRHQGGAGRPPLAPHGHGRREERRRPPSAGVISLLSLHEWRRKPPWRRGKANRWCLGGWEGGRGAPTTGGRGGQDERASSVGGWGVGWRAFSWFWPLKIRWGLR